VVAGTQWIAAAALGQISIRIDDRHTDNVCARVRTDVDRGTYLLGP